MINGATVSLNLGVVNIFRYVAVLGIFCLMKYFFVMNSIIINCGFFLDLSGHYMTEVI